MIERCPKCGEELDALGIQADGVWTFDNLWGCRRCPPGLNRYVRRDRGGYLIVAFPVLGGARIDWNKPEGGLAE